MGGIVKKIRQKMMRPVFLEVEHQILQNSKVTSTPNKRWKGSVSCLMKGKRRGMWLPSFLYFQPNKVKSGQYQTTNTYNKLIEPEQWNQASDLSGMNNLLKLLTTKNVKAKLGKGGTAMQGSFSVQDTFSFVVPYSSNHTNSSGSSGPIKTAYPVKKSEASTVKINSLINATPLNSYGDLNNHTKLIYPNYLLIY